MDELLAKDISIHAPREGSDVTTMYNKHEIMKFLSTLPARGATTSGTTSKRR